MNPKIRIIGVQAENVSPLADYKQTDELRYIEPMAGTLADGVNIKVRTHSYCVYSIYLCASGRMCLWRTCRRSLSSSPCAEQ